MLPLVIILLLNDRYFEFISFKFELLISEEACTFCAGFFYAFSTSLPLSARP